MPLNVEVIRARKPVQVRWGHFHLNAMYTAAVREAAPELELASGVTIGEFDGIVDFASTGIYYLDIEAPLVRRGEQTLLDTHEFVDPTDGEVFTLLPGDVLRAWRD